MLNNQIIKQLQVHLLNIRVCLSILVLIDGLMILVPFFSSYTGYTGWGTVSFTEWLQSLGFMKLLDIPRFMLGLSLVFLSFFMLVGARIGWLFSLFVLFIIILMDLVFVRDHGNQGLFSLALFIASIVAWRKFPRHSLTSASFVAVICTVGLIVYSVFGTLYIGDQFQPHVTDLASAFYFALVCMTTVGFGDIVPISIEARMFTLTVVIFGITIFTTSIVYIVGVLAKGTREIVKKRLSHMNEHYVVIGANPLAVNVYKGLKKRGLEAVVICNEEQKTQYPDGAVVIVGDPTLQSDLQTASVKNAKCVMVLSSDDTLNTFTILAVKALTGESAKIVTLVNCDDNMDKIRLLHPDMAFSLSSLGSEVLMKMLCGESINNTVMADILLAEPTK